jgi:hypothetical protein
VFSGLTVKVLPVIPPGFHVKDPPCVLVVAIKVTDCPEQIVALVAVIVGVGLTVTVPEATGAAQPAAVL